MIAQYKSIEDAKAALNLQSEAGGLPQEKTEPSKSRSNENTAYVGENTEGGQEPDEIERFRSLEIDGKEQAGQAPPDIDTSRIFSYENITPPINITILPSPLHGFGVFTLQPIAASSTIFTELYAFSYTQKSYTEANLTAYIATLCSEYQELFRALSAGAWSPPRFFSADMATFLTNSFELPGGAGLRSKGIFWVAGRVNHSCVPSATFFKNDDGEVRFVALRDIAAGEEITIAYCCGLDLPERMREPLGFKCKCGMCLSRPEAGAAGKKTMGCDCSFCSRDDGLKGKQKKAKVSTYQEPHIIKMDDSEYAQHANGFRPEFWGMKDDDGLTGKGKANLSTYQQLVEAQLSRENGSEDADKFEFYDPAAFGPDIVPQKDGKEDVVDDDDDEDETFRATDLTPFGDIGEEEDDFSDDDTNADDDGIDEDDLDQLDVRPGVHNFLE
ncbi:hypothetical protein B7494_g6987 [Chlorociboria aeruginascens]|nr:hypothetical protein B7494_g6987 [Chlorociboria aeruginascens]